MQITNFSAPRVAFGQKHNAERKTDVPQEETRKVPNKAVALTRNAMIAGLVGLLAGCAQDRYFIDIADDGYPIIYNQDGDCIDFVPKKLKKDVERLEANMEQSQKNYQNIGKEIIYDEDEYEAIVNDSDK